MRSLDVQLSSALNSAANGRELAEAVLRELQASDVAQLDFSTVERMTPSFANAFVMVVLERCPIDRFRARVTMINQAPNVAAAIEKSVARYSTGIRLSSQAARLEVTAP